MESGSKWKLLKCEVTGYYSSKECRDIYYTSHILQRGKLKPRKGKRALRGPQWQDSGLSALPGPEAALDYPYVMEGVDDITKVSPAWQS